MKTHITQTADKKHNTEQTENTENGKYQRRTLKNKQKYRGEHIQTNKDKQTHNNITHTE